MSRNVQYTGYKDPRIQHAPYCKSPHPNAVVVCTCPASADLGYQTQLATMSVDQYDMLYRAAPMPVHKLKAIRHKRHVMQPDNREYWPKDQSGRPYDPRRYGYPKNWLGDAPQTMLLDQRGEPLPSNPRSETTAPESRCLECGVSSFTRSLQHPTSQGNICTPCWRRLGLDQIPPSTPASAPANPKNFWEETVTPEQQQRWHTDPTYEPEPEFSPEKLRRMEQRRRSSSPTPSQSPQPLSPVYPTATQSAQQRQEYLQAPPMTPHTQRQCRTPLIADVPGSTVPLVVECESESEHSGAPHMTRIPGRRPSQVIYLTWMDE